MAIAKGLKRIAPYEHVVVSLLPPDEEALPMAQDAGITVLVAPDWDHIRREIERADIVHVEWWNNPKIDSFLRSVLPPMRLLVFVHVAGDSVPFVVTPELVRFADFYVAGCGYTHRLPVIEALPALVRNATTAVVIATTDLDRIAGLRQRPHPTFNVGYIGKVDFRKMHPNYVAMSARARVPAARFIVCGAGHIELLARQAEHYGAAERFEFRGYVHDIRSVLELLDVFGYPLGMNPGAELSLQEAMIAGVPPVVFPRGGIVDAVIHRHTGLVVDSEADYADAIEYLYHNPDERKRLGESARRFASKHFGGAQSARALDHIYQTMLRRPKRTRRWPPSDCPDAAATSPSGSRCFAQSLGEHGTPFFASLADGDGRQLIRAEEDIAVLSMMTLQVVSDYSDSYPDDPYLLLWGALILEAQGQYALARRQFARAQELGLRHWRLAWYRARTSQRLGEINDALEQCRAALSEVPDFQPARELFALLQRD
jgi:glycosyltransferase involved in cell wall biosynthesis